MRHRNKKNSLGRKAAHRGAMLSNMATSLIMHKRIFTTVPKAKELRKFVEPIITVSKEDTTNSRRIAFSKLQNKYAVTELFQTVSQKVGDRPGGYTRIIKTGHRLGDNASMCFIELVDFNENMLSDSTATKTKTRRSRRRKSSGSDANVAAAVTTAETDVKKAKEVKKPEVKPEDIDANTKVEVAEDVATEADVQDKKTETESVDEDKKD